MSNKLKLLRTSKGFTQAKVATDFNITQATYGRIETGRIRLTTERLEQFAQYYKVESAYILSKSGDPLDFGMDMFTQEYIGQLIKDNRTLREGILKNLEEDNTHLREQNKLLLEKLNSTK